MPDQHRWVKLFGLWSMVNKSQRSWVHRLRTWWCGWRQQTANCRCSLPTTSPVIFSFLGKRLRRPLQKCRHCINEATNVFDIKGLRCCTKSLKKMWRTLFQVVASRCLEV
eukprot:symbB.v1.2.000539.t1/scaffold19.1/size443072/3